MAQKIWWPVNLLVMVESKMTNSDISMKKITLKLLISPLENENESNLKLYHWEIIVEWKRTSNKPWK